MVKNEPAKSGPTTWREKLERLDLVAFTFFLGSILCLVLALLWGGKEYPWKNARIIVLLILFGAFMAVFMAMQVRKGDKALVPMSIIARRSIAFGMFFSFCTSGTGFILEYYVSLQLPIRVEKGLSTNFGPPVTHMATDYPKLLRHLVGCQASTHHRGSSSIYHTRRNTDASHRVLRPIHDNRNRAPLSMHGSAIHS